MEVRINDAEAGHRIADLAFTNFVPNHDVCFSSHREDGTFLGGVILTDFTGAAMTIHDGSVNEHWCTRDLLWLTFHYPFVQLGCKSLVGLTPRHNAHALAFAMKVGFEIETVIRDCLPGGDDLVVTRMWRDKCRWLKLKPRTLACNHSLIGVR